MEGQENDLSAATVGDGVAIFVIGMHRAGTSMVASVLEKLGVHFGAKDDMLPANSANELGYFEHRGVLTLNDALARANKTTWRTLPSLDTSSRVAGIDEYLAGVREIVAAMEPHAPWGVKDPRLSFFLPFWRAHARSVHVVICVRRPEPVARSLLRRNNLPLAYGAALWELYTLAALASAERFPRTTVVYEDFVANPERAVAQLAAKLREWEGLNPRPEQLENAASQIRPELDHGDDATEQNGAASVEQLAFYERLRQDEDSPHPSTSAVVSKEMVRLEQAHQTAKATVDTLRSELAHQSVALDSERSRIEAVQERLADLLGWARVAETGAASLPAANAIQEPASLEGQLESLRNVVHVAGQFAAVRSLMDVARADLIASKDERIAWRESELRRLADRLIESEERYQTIFVEVLELRAHAEMAERAIAESTRIRKLLASAEEECAALRTQLDAAKHHAQDDRRQVDQATEEVEALRQALQLARSAPAPKLASAGENRAAAVVAASTSHPSDAARRESYRRRFKAMQKVIKSIDQLLSPPLGRFAIPVRQVRSEVVRLRTIVAEELTGQRDDSVNEE